MPNESRPRALSVALRPGVRPPSARSGPSTPSDDNPRAAPHSLAQQRSNASSKPPVGAFVHKLKPSQPAAKQQSSGVRLSYKSSYAAQCAAVAPPRALPKAPAIRHVPNRSVTSQQSSTSPDCTMEGNPIYNNLEAEEGQIIRLDLSEMEETQSGCSPSADCSLGVHSGRESSDTSARFEDVATESSRKGVLFGDTNSTCSGSSTPRIEGHRGQSDEIAAVIAAARFAASRWSMDFSSITDRSIDRREIDLYIDYAKLKWRQWIKEMSREEGQEQASEEALGLHTASFAAHLLWQHDRAISEADRCNALCRESRVQTELAEEAVSRLEQESASANAFYKLSQEATDKYERLETLEQHRVLELNSAVTLSEHLEHRLEDSECKKESLRITLAETVDSLHRSEESLSWLEQESVSANALCKESSEASQSAQQALEALEQHCALERSRTLARCQHLEAMLEESDCKEDALRMTLAKTAERLLRSEESFSRLEQELASANAFCKQSQEATEKYERMELLEQQCALELSSELSRSEHLEHRLEESECKKDSLRITLMETADSLHRSEESLSVLGQESVSANALCKQSREATQKYERLEALEQQCALELSSALARSQHLEIVLEESERNKDSLCMTLAATTDSLHRSAEAYQTQSSRLANLDEEANAHSEVVHALRHELNECQNVVVQDRTAELAQELQRMKVLYEIREAELQEMIACAANRASNECSVLTFGQHDPKQISEVSVQSVLGIRALQTEPVKRFCWA